jgi:hypothetical protein
MGCSTVNRYNTGWVELPPTPRYPETLVHRPDPDHPQRVMCNRVLPADAEILPDHRALHMCGACNLQVGHRKLADKRAKRRAARLEAEQKAAAQPQVQPRGGSIRALRGGLPGLGRRS